MTQMLTQMLIGCGLVLLLGYSFIVAYACIVGPRAIFPAPPPGYHSDIVTGWIESPRCPFLFYEAAKPIATVLYCHGNAEDLGDIRPLMEEFERRGFTVFAFDYPGYGLADGTASEFATFAAAEGAWEWLTNKQGIGPRDILLYGRSLGSGPATWLAQRNESRGLVLDGAFTSTFRVATRIRLLWWDNFDNLKRIPDVTAPILSIHGWQDRTCPIGHARKLVEAAHSPVTRLWDLRAGHNNLIETAGETYWQTLGRFANKSHHAKISP